MQNFFPTNPVIWVRWDMSTSISAAIVCCQWNHELDRTVWTTSNWWTIAPASCIMPQATSQTANRRTWLLHPLCCWIYLTIIVAYQWLNQPTNQPTNRPTNKSANQPTNKPTNQTYLVYCDAHHHVMNHHSWSLISTISTFNYQPWTNIHQPHPTTSR